MSYVQSRRLNTLEEQSEGRALEEVLDKCITLVVRRMALGSDGAVLTKKDAAAKAAQEDEDAAAAQTGAADE